MRYLAITHPDIENGSGCRVTLWIPGCRHKCPGCHTPWTHDYDQGMDFTQQDFEGLCQILEKDYIAGLTISGGDPLMQSDDVLIDLCQLTHDIKELFPNKPIWIYTGYTLDILNFTTLKKGICPECLHYNMMTKILQMCDVVVDGPYIEDQRDITLPFRGSKNQRLINVKETLKQGQIIQYKIN